MIHEINAKNLIFVYTGIFPFIALSYMNLHIFLKIRQSRQVQKTLEQNCVKYPTKPRHSLPRFWAGARTRSGRASSTWRWLSSQSSSCTSSATSSGSSLAFSSLHSWVRISYLFVEFWFCHDLNAEKYKSDNVKLHNIHGIFTLSRYQ